MLKDRRVLLEQELKRAHDRAAEVYLTIVVAGGIDTSPEYEHLKNRISDLQFELRVVEKLIDRGTER